MFLLFLIFGKRNERTNLGNRIEMNMNYLGGGRFASCCFYSEMLMRLFLSLACFSLGDYALVASCICLGWVACCVMVAIPFLRYSVRMCLSCVLFVAPLRLGYCTFSLNHRHFGPTIVQQGPSSRYLNLYIPNQVI